YILRNKLAGEEYLQFFSKCSSELLEDIPLL
ncbi:hypothetical protein EAI_06048, partial [Harpegnathos saltator]